MATKPATGKKLNKVIVETSAASKPRASRVTSAKHSKAAVTEVFSDSSAVEVMAQPTTEISHDVISKIAYGFWQSRGYQGGDAAEDWFRAEAEYRSN